MKKFFRIKGRPGKKIYQDPKEAEKHFRTQAKDFQRFARAILDFLPIKSGKLLDVGCGFGWVVAEAQKRGFTATGIDEAKPYITLGKWILRADLRHASLEKFSAKEKFDVVVLNHVLEHIKKPKDFLAKIRKLLSPGGLLFVACPNINSLMYWIFKDRWYGLQPAQHVWQFTGKSLPSEIATSGFIIDRIKINSLNYQPKGWKKIIFWLLTSFADAVGWGDQVFVIAHKENA